MPSAPHSASLQRLVRHAARSASPKSVGTTKCADNRGGSPYKGAFGYSFGRTINQGMSVIRAFKRGLIGGIRPTSPALSSAAVWSPILDDLAPFYGRVSIGDPPLLKPVAPDVFRAYSL